MFLRLAHVNLEIYQTTKKFVKECYLLSAKFPTEERFNMCSQLKRAALSVHLNNAEGCSRKSPAERARFFEISRSSLVEVDAILELAYEMNYVQIEQAENLGKLIISSFKLLTGLINSTNK